MKSFCVKVFSLLTAISFIVFFISCKDKSALKQKEQPAKTQPVEITVQPANQIPVFKKNALFSCGSEPKQVLFSPDNSCIVLPLLDGKGFQIIQLAGDHIPLLVEPPNKNKLGFAEGLFIPEKNSFFVSQMTTANIYEYTYPGFIFKRTVSTQGTWSKFIAWSAEKQQLAASNWVSNDVSLIDYETGNVVQKIKTAAAPRGLAYIKKGDSIIVLCFDGGVIQEFNTQDGLLIASIPVEKSAMRHIVVNKEETFAYISDMYHAAIYVVDLQSFSITKTYHVYNNPNTIALLQDKFLVVSSRGPNNTADYTKRSPSTGKITVIDTTDGTVIQTIDGGNQPTGLAISSDAQHLCFSNFQDAAVELYDITFVKKEN